MATLNNVSYPYAQPTVSGSTITVEALLAQPTRITRYLSDLPMRNFISPLIFTTTGGVSGGSVVYDQLTLNDLFSTRDVQNVEPGTEFPLVTSENPAPKIASVEKYGGKFFVTDEARDRNDGGVVQREGRKLINTIQRKTDQKAIATLDASISAISSQTVTGVNWNNVVTGASASTASLWPAADLSKVQLLADTQELGVTFDLWIVNPAQKAQFDLVYGTGAADVLSSYGVRMVASNRVTAGTAYVVASGQVGEIRLEKPLTTETWREQETQRTWVQSDVRPVMFVTDPYSVVKVKSLDGSS